MPDSPPATVTVVIPVHNEASYIGGAIPELFAELEGVPAAIEVLIAENGSSDDTAAIVRAEMRRHPALRLLQLAEADYGAAMRAGFLAADTDWVVNFDIDYFSGDFLRQALALGGGADLVLASKRAEGADDRRTTTRRLATWVFNKVLRFVLGSRVTDTHGMKAIRREVVTAVVPSVESTQDLFDTELVVRAERAGYRIVEVPAFVEEKRQAKSKIWKRVPRTLRGVWRIRRSLRR